MKSEGCVEGLTGKVEKFLERDSEFCREVVG